MKPLRVLAIIEAETLTGPARNLIGFAKIAKSGILHPPVEMVLASYLRAGRHSLLQEAAAREEIPIEMLPESGKYDLDVLRRLRELVDQVKPDLIQTHAVKSHFLCRLARLPDTAPWIAFHHGYTWTDLRMRLFNQLDRWSLRSASRVVTVSGPFRRELVRCGIPADRIEVIHNAVAPDWGSRLSDGSCAGLRRRLQVPDHRKIILSVGRLSREKDHGTLIESFRILLQGSAGMDAHLVIIGEGPERRSLESAVRTAGLSDRVTLAGHVPSPEDFYGMADLMVLSSRTEGSPNTLLEAAAAGVPIVATAVGGVPEIFTDMESALLVPPGSPPILAQAMKTLLENKSLATRLAARARERMLERHRPEDRARRLQELYLSVLGRSGKDWVKE